MGADPYPLQGLFLYCSTGSAAADSRWRTDSRDICRYMSSIMSKLLFAGDAGTGFTQEALRELLERLGPVGRTDVQPGPRVSGRLNRIGVRSGSVLPFRSASCGLARNVRLENRAAWLRDPVRGGGFALFALLASYFDWRA